MILFETLSITVRDQRNSSERRQAYVSPTRSVLVASDSAPTVCQWPCLHKLHCTDCETLAPSFYRSSTKGHTHMCIYVSKSICEEEPQRGCWRESGWESEVKLSACALVAMCVSGLDQLTSGDEYDWRRGRQFFQDRSSPARECHMCGGHQTCLEADKIVWERQSPSCMPLL